MHFQKPYGVWLPSSSRASGGLSSPDEVEVLAGRNRRRKIIPPGAARRWQQPPSPLDIASSSVEQRIHVPDFGLSSISRKNCFDYTAVCYHIFKSKQEFHINDTHTVTAPNLRTSISWISKENNNFHSGNMVCSKCAKKLAKTELATPAVKRRTDMYYGSPSTSFGGGSSSKSAKPSPTLGNTGVSKVSVHFPVLCSCVVSISWDWSPVLIAEMTE